MEPCRVGTLVEMIVVLIALLSLQVSIIGPNEASIIDIDMSEANWLIKQVNKNIKSLKNSRDTNLNEKETLKDYEEKIDKLVSKLNEFHNSNIKMEKLEQIVNETVALGDSIEVIKYNSEARKKLRLFEECVEEVANSNYPVAIIKLNLMNDYDMVRPIVFKIYNRSRSNFVKIREFGDKIPSISLSFEVYKSLKKAVDASKQFDLEIGLQLMESLKTYIIEQFACEQSIEFQAIKLMDKIKRNVKNLIVPKLGKAIEEETADKDVFQISERITYWINDRKFFREISEDVARIYFPKNEETFHQSMLKVTNNFMRSVPRIYLYTALFEQIMSQKGLDLSFIKRLIMLQKGMQAANEKEWKEFKHSTNQLWKTTPRIENAAIKRFKNALLNLFYHKNEMNQLSKTLAMADLNIFDNVMKASVKEIYGKVSILNLLQMFRKSQAIRQCVIGYEAVYECMKESGELEINEKNLGAVLKLESVVSDKLSNNNLRYEQATLVTKLQKIHRPLKDLRSYVFSKLKIPVLYGNYTKDEYYPTLCNHIFQADTFWFFMENLVNALHAKLSTQKLIDYMMWLPRIEYKMMALEVLQNKLNKNSTYLYAVAQNYKNLTNSKEFLNIGIGFKAALQRKALLLPFPVRQAVFSKEVFIKNLNWGEYLHTGFEIEKMKQAVSHITWKTLNRTKWVLEYSGNESVYKIKCSRNEYLVASEDEFIFNNDSRRVFLQTDDQTGRGNWRFMPSDRGIYIRNEFYKEYLFAGSQVSKEKRLIFTWRSDEKISNAKWAIEDATSGYSIDD